MITHLTELVDYDPQQAYKLFEELTDYPPFIKLELPEYWPRYDCAEGAD